MSRLIEPQKVVFPFGAEDSEHFINDRLGLDYKKRLIANKREQFKDNEYILQGLDFLINNGFKLVLYYQGKTTSPWNKTEAAQSWSFTLTTPKGSYKADFYNSIAATEKGEIPTAYDILACINCQLMDAIGSIDDFCDNYGYSSDDTPISEIIRTYEAVIKESQGLMAILTTDQQDQLNEIC